MLLAHLALEVCLQTYNPIWKRMLALFSQWGQTNLRGLQAHHRLDQHFRIRLVLEPKRTLQCLPDISSAFTNFRRPLHDDFHDTQPAHLHGSSPPLGPQNTKLLRICPTDGSSEYVIGDRMCCEPFDAVFRAQVYVPENVKDWLWSLDDDGFE